MDTQEIVEYIHAQREEFNKKLDLILRLISVISLILLVFICTAHAYTDSQAVKAIIGEAENQGDTGMLAVACAIKNRGTLHGVYGLNAPRVKQHKYSDSIYTTASKAWAEADVNNCGFIHGAKNWENVSAFGLPYWAKNMRIVFVYKDHKFFK